MTKTRQPKSNRPSTPAASDLGRQPGSLMMLESRIAFDAAALPTLEAALHERAHHGGEREGSHAAPHRDDHGLLIDALKHGAGAVSPHAGSGRSEIAFIDSSVADVATLMKGIGANVEIVMIDTTRDGVDQMAAALSGRHDISAIHIVSHGSEANLSLGTATLNVESMQTRYAADLAAIGAALTERADILVYGCDFAKGADGAEAARLLAGLTRADVAASTDATGAGRLGGDWVLEDHTGRIETHAIGARGSEAAWDHLLTAPTLDLDASSAGVNYTATLTNTTDAVRLVGFGGAVADADANLTSLRIVASGIANGSAESLNIAGQKFVFGTARTATATFGGNGNYSFDIAYDGSNTFTITRTGGGSWLNAGEQNTFLRAIVYANGSIAATGTRTFTFTATDATAATATATSTVTISLANTAPLIGAPSGSATGEVAAYGFNNGSGNSPSLVAGAPSLTVANGATYAVSASRTGTGYGLLFPGGTGNTPMASLTALPGDIVAQGSMTVSGWIRFDTTAAWTRFIDFSTGTDANNNIWIGRDASTSNLSLQVFNGTASQGVIEVPSAIANGSWMQITATFAANGETALYVNGALAGKTILAAQPNFAALNVLRFGTSAFAGDSVLTGAIDDIHFYNRALNAAEVQALYGSQGGSMPHAITVLESSNYVFSAATGNAITIGDATAGSGNETTTLSVGTGTLTLGSTAGVTVTGNGTGTVTITGTITATNTALNGLTYTPPSLWLGNTTLSISVNDNGNTGTPGPLTTTDSIAVEVSSFTNSLAVDLGTHTAVSGTSASWVPQTSFNSAVISSVANEVFGSGLGYTILSSSTAVTGANATSLAQALLGNDYIEETFTTAANMAADTVLTVAGVGQYASNAYTMTMLISSDNFATSTVLLRDFSPTSTGSYTFNAPNVPDFKLLAGKTYQIRNYVYNATGGAFKWDDFAIATATEPSTTTATFAEGGAAVPITTGPTIEQVSTGNLTGATIVLTNAKAGDALTIAGTLPAGIASNIDTSISGKITVTLSGSASLANYQTALAQLRYGNSGTNIDGTARVVTVKVTDGIYTSNIAANTISVVSGRASPSIDLNGQVTGSDAVYWDLEANSIANTTIVKSAATPTAPVWGSGLTATNRAPADSWDVTGATATTAVAAIEANAYLEHSFQVNGVAGASYALTGFGQTCDAASGRAALYISSDGFKTAQLLADFSLAGSGSRLNLNVPDVQLTSGTTYTIREYMYGATGTVRVDGMYLQMADDPNGNAVTVTSAAPSVAIASNVALEDADSTTLAGATIVLTNAVSGDRLAILGSLPSGIAATTDSSVAGKITLTLSGSASLASYQTAIGQVRFDTTSTDQTMRTVDITATDGTYASTAARATVAFNVTSVNHAPAGADRTVTTTEDTAHVFTVTDFGFSDSADTPANALLAAKIATLPAAGSLTLSGVAVTTGQSISAADITAGKLAWTPAADANGAAQSSFTFQVQDDGGRFNGGADTDASPNTITLDVTAVNDAPTGADATLTGAQDTDYVFSAGDFGFSDPNDTPADNFAGIRIAALPVDGTLTLSGVAVSSGDLVPAADIAAGHLVYAPAAGASGTGIASFRFQVYDDGGSANGGRDTDQSPNTITFDITAAPVVSTSSPEAPLEVAAPSGPPPSVAAAISLDLGGQVDGTPAVTWDYEYFNVDKPGLIDAGTTVRTLTYGTGIAVDAFSDHDSWSIYGATELTPEAAVAAGDYVERSFTVSGTAGQNLTLTAIRQWNDAFTGRFAVYISSDDFQTARLLADYSAEGDHGYGHWNTYDTPDIQLQAGATYKIREYVYGDIYGEIRLDAMQIVVAEDASGLTTVVGNSDVNVRVATNVAIEQVGSAGMTGATATLTNARAGDSLFVAGTLPDGITATTDTSVAGRITVTFSGAASAADYQTAIGQLRFGNSGTGFDTTARTVTVTVTDGSATSNQAVSTIRIGNVEGKPSLNIRPDAWPGDVLTWDVEHNGALDATVINVDRSPTEPVWGPGLTAERYFANESWQITGVSYATAADAIAADAYVEHVFEVNDNPGSNYIMTGIGQWLNSDTGRAAIYISSDGFATSRLLADLSLVNDVGWRADINTPDMKLTPGVTYTLREYIYGAGTPARLDQIWVQVIDDPHGFVTQVLQNAMDTAIVFNPGIEDPDSLTMAGATFVLTDARAGGLSVSGDLPAGITATVDSSVAGKVTLKLSGEASATDYQTAIAQVHFTNSGAAPSTATRHVSITVNDGTVCSDPVVSTIEVIATSPSSTANHAPTGADHTATVAENGSYTISSADFGFADADDSPSNVFAGVKFVTLPANGSLTVNGVAVIEGHSVSVSDIDAGLLVWTPDAGTSGSGLSSFTFEVQDDGGTDNNGFDTDATARTFTFDVTAATIATSGGGVPAANHAPAGADHTATLSEDGSYTIAGADFGFSDANDSPANALSAVKIVTLPANGILTLNGVAVTAGQSISAADIAAGKLVWTPAANASGTGLGSFTFKVVDDGGTANGGADTDTTARTFTFDVASVNDAPTGADATITTLEDTAHVFAAADFGFSDTHDSPANTLSAVRIVTLPANGSLTLNGSAVTAGQSVSAADISAGKLSWTPAANASGTGLGSFTFKVQDDGGTANGGVDTDPTARTVTFTVAAVNDAPAGSSHVATLLEDGSYTLANADFGFTDTSDSPANALSAVTIVTLPANGTLTLNGVAFTAGQSVLAADIAAGKLVWTPAANASGTGLGAFTFKVVDDGGTADGGVDRDMTARTFSFTVTAVNDAPTGASHTATVGKDTAYTLANADFGFADASDTPANAFSAVTIVTLPASGTLTLNGAAVSAGQSIAAADIAAGRLVWTPDAGATGAGLASFTFKVQDDGGTANGGVDVDATARTFTFDVLSPNHAPTGANVTITTQENTGHVFATSEFGFSDAGDTPANALSAVKIVTLPARGTLTLNGVAVVAGQAVSAADIASGNLVWTPDAFANGTGLASFTFKVQDDGGTANGGADTDTTARTVTFNVTADPRNTVIFVVNGSYVSVAQSGLLGSLGTATLDRLVIVLSNAGSGDEITPIGFLPGGISAATSSAGGKFTVTLTGTATIASYETALSRYYFRNMTSAAVGFTRTIGLIATSGATSTLIDANAIEVISAFGTPSGTYHGVLSGTDAVSWDYEASAVLDTTVIHAANTPLTTTWGSGVTAVAGGSADRWIVSGATAANANAAVQSRAYLEHTFQVTANAGAGMTYVLTGINQTLDAATGRAAVYISADGFKNTLKIADFALNGTGTRSDIPTTDYVLNPGTTYTLREYFYGAMGTIEVDAMGLSIARDPTTRSVSVLNANASVNVAPNVILEDADSANPSAALVTLDNPKAGDTLAVSGTLPPGISASVVTSGGKITLRLLGGSSFANYTTALQQVQFRNAGVGFDTTTRNITYTIGDGVTQSKFTSTINIIDVNAHHAPSGADHIATTTEDTAYTLATADFGFTDANETTPDTLFAVIVVTLPATGTLALNGIAVTAGQSIAAADIAAGNLVWTPEPGANGAGLASFTFKVQDNGGTAYNGADTDTIARTFTFDVISVNDAPTGADTTVTLASGAAHAFTAADFGFSDGNDTPANALAAVEIVTLPASGALTLNGQAVTAGQLIPAGDLAAGLLVWTPDAHNTGSGLDSLTFKVHDDGGTDHGGIDTDQTARTITLDMTASSTPLTIDGGSGSADAPLVVSAPNGLIAGVPGFGSGGPYTVTGINGTRISSGDTVTLSSGAKLTVNSDGSYSYDPNGAWYRLGGTQTGNDTFSYVVTDQNGGTTTVNATIHIQGVDDPLSISGLSGQPVPTVIGTPSTGGFTATSVDQTQSLVINGVTVTGPGQTFAGPHGTLTITSYDPATGQVGYSYTPTTANDPGTGPAIDTFTVTVTDVDGDTESAALSFGIPDTPPLTINGGSGSADAPLVVSAPNGLLASVPGFGSGGPYTVTGINGTPIAGGDTITLPSGAKLTVNGDGSYSYDPNGAWNSLGGTQTANDTFSYVVTDPNGGTTTVNATIHIQGIDDPLSISGLSGQPVPTTLGTPSTGGFTATSVDQTQSLVINGVTVTGPGQAIAGPHGTLTIVSYDPTTGQVGYSYAPTTASDPGTGPAIDRFNVTVTDVDGDMRSGTLSFGIPATPPLTVSGGSGSADTPLVVSAPNGLIASVLGFGSGGPYTVTGINGTPIAGGDTITLPSGAKLTVNGDGSYSYDPNGAWNSLGGTQSTNDTFSYVVTDQNGGTTTVIATIHIQGVDDPLSISGLSGQPVPTTVGTPSTGGFTATSVDQTQSLVINGVTVTGPGQAIAGPHGMLTIVSYDPTTGQVGYSYTPTSAADPRTGPAIDTFTITVTDVDGDTRTAALAFRVPQPTDGGSSSGGDSLAPERPVAVLSDPDGDGRIDVSGSAEPGALVIVTWPDGSTSTAVADARGRWAVESPLVQRAGVVSIEARDVAGNCSGSVSLGFAGAVARANGTSLEDTPAPLAFDATSSASLAAPVTVTEFGVGSGGTVASVVHSAGSFLSNIMAWSGTQEVVRQVLNNVDSLSGIRAPAGNTPPPSGLADPSALDPFRTVTFLTGGLRFDPPAASDSPSFGLDSTLSGSSIVLSLHEGALDQRVVSFEILGKDGSPLPDWIRRTDGRSLVIESPPGGEGADVVIRAVLDNGTVIVEQVHIDRNGNVTRVRTLEKASLEDRLFSRQLASQDMGDMAEFAALLKALSA